MGITFLIVDGLNLVRRIYGAQPGDDGPERVQSAISTSVQSLRRSLKEVAPTHAVAVFDGAQPGWRHQRYPAYKADRPPMPASLKEGLSSIADAFSEEGVSSLSFSELEADDVIATLAGKVALKNGRVVILSTDKIFIQLLSDFITVRDHFQKRDLDRAWVRQKYGVEPERFVDLLALAGDATNNIPGVPSVGMKTAARLVSEIGDLETILALAHTIPGKTGEMIYRHSEEARLARDLACLKTDLPWGSI